MGFTKESLIAPPPVPDNLYTLKLVKFRPKASEKGTSFNLNAQFEITTPGFEHNGRARMVYESLNSNFGQSTLDYVHATGLELAVIGKDENGEDLMGLPGVFVGQLEHPDDPSKWAYKGPLIGRGFQAELTTTTYQDKKRNNVRAYICSVPDCAVKYPDIKHSQNLISNK